VNDVRCGGTIQEDVRYNLVDYRVGGVPEEIGKVGGKWSLWLRLCACAFGQECLEIAGEMGWPGEEGGQGGSLSICGSLESDNDLSRIEAFRWHRGEHDDAECGWGHRGHIRDDKGRWLWVEEIGLGVASGRGGEGGGGCGLEGRVAVIEGEWDGMRGRRFRSSDEGASKKGSKGIASLF
jgi:hypothetical protein